MSETGGWRDAFRLEGGFFKRDGRAYAPGPPPCNKKLCLTSTDLDAMGELLDELSRREDCWAVKLDTQVGRHGMVRGRCFLTTEEAVAELWKRYKVTDTMLCTIQDDDMTVLYRE